MIELSFDQIFGIVVLAFCLGMIFTMVLIDVTIDRHDNPEVWKWWNKKR